MAKFFEKIKDELLVFGLFVLSRLPSLGQDIFNTDVWKWKQRIYDFGSGIFYLDFAKTIQKYHPGVTLMWLGALAVKVQNFIHRLFPPKDALQQIFDLHFMQKLFVVIAVALAISLVFHALRKLFGLSYAFLAVGLISLEPFYVALTRVLHLEGLMSTFMIASFVWLFYALDSSFLGKRYWGKLSLSGIFAGLAILTKTSSLFLIPFSALTLFFVSHRYGKSIREIIKTSSFLFLVWLLAVILSFVAFWPAMWVSPLEALNTVYRGISVIGVERGHEQIYFGQKVLDPGPTFYFVALFYRSSLYIILGLLLFIFKTKGSLDKKKEEFIISALLFALLYFVELIIPSKKLDRYILPSLMALTLVAGFSYSWLIDEIEKKVFKLWIVVLLFIPAVITLIYLHPDYFSYYSPLGGGLKKGVCVLEPKWVIGQSKLATYFKKLSEEKGYVAFAPGEDIKDLESLQSKLVLAFPEKYYTQLWPHVREIGGWAVIEDLTDEAKDAKYFIYPVWDDYSFRETRFQLKFLDQVSLRKVPIYNIYEKIK